jgi:toxin ParE1/3/4
MSSPKPLLIAPAARRDIAAVLQYTEEEWGEAQASRYRAKLDASFGKIGRNPDIASGRPDMPPIYRALRVGSHVIIYQNKASFVEIVRILHQRMNRADHL